MPHKIILLHRTFIVHAKITEFYINTIFLHLKSYNTDAHVIKIILWQITHTGLL